MKKVFLLIFITLFNFSFAQKQTLFLDKNYNDVIQKAAIEKKPLIIMFYATWCPHCNTMKNDIFTDKDVINFYNNSFTCMAVDAESKEGWDLRLKLQTKLKVSSFPTFGVFDANENLLACFSGEFKKEDFINEGNNTLNPENQITFLKNKFYNDLSNADNCLKYIFALRKSGLDTTKEAQKYLNTKSEQELFSEINWKIIANGINNIEAAEIKYVASNMEKFAKVSSPTRVQKKLVFITSDNLQPLAEIGDTLKYYKKRAIAESFRIRKVDSLLFKYDILISEKTKNWKNYQTVTKSNIEKFCWNDSNTLIEICTNYLNFINGKSANSDAIRWTKQALILSESKEKYILLSKLYLKDEDFESALAFAVKGKNNALNFGWNTDEFDKLISNIYSKRQK